MEDGNPLGNFAIPVRLPIILSLVVAGGGTVAYTLWIHELLPAGSYPCFIFVVPGLMGAGLVFGVDLGIFRVCGVPIWRNPPEPTEEDAGESEGPLGP
jgi:hypothetical protein